MTEPSPAPRPLAGLSVVELGALIAGPFCTKVLAEFGADVIKLEPPDGDQTRGADASIARDGATARLDEPSAALAPQVVMEIFRTIYRITRDGMTLTPSFVATINAELKVGTLTETVTVTGSGFQLDQQLSVGVCQRAKLSACLIPNWGFTQADADGNVGATGALDAQFQIGRAHV